MQRAPIPPKDIEYAVYIYRRTEERTGDVYTVFNFQTTREFTNFRYALNVEASFDADEREFTFIIGGIGIPSSLMPSIGTAQGVHTYTNLKPGEYKITIMKGKGKTNIFTLHSSNNSLKIETRPLKTKPFINTFAGAPATPLPN